MEVNLNPKQIKIYHSITQNQDLRVKDNGGYIIIYYSMYNMYMLIWKRKNEKIFRAEEMEKEDVPFFNNLHVNWY